MERTIEIWVDRINWLWDQNQHSLSAESDVEEPLPLDLLLILSSTIDISTFQTAHNILNQYMNSNPAFKTLVWNFVNHFIKSLQHLWAYNTILEASYSVLKEVTVDRKRRENEVRTVLKGKHIITAADIYE